MKAKNILGGIVFFVLAIFAIVYLMIQMISGLTSDVTFEFASSQSFEQTLEKTAYIVRSEEVLFSEGSGILSYNVAESQKIGSGQLVATIYSDEQGIDIQNKIDEIDIKLAILNRSSIDTGYLTSDISKIDEKIELSVSSCRNSVEDNDLSLIQKYKEELLINMNKRDLVTSGKGDFSEQIASLQAERDQLTATLQNPISSVYSGKTGYFSTLLDGYESVFKPESLEKMTISDFDAMVNAERVEYPDSAIGKLITDFDWHTLCEVTSSEAETMSIGQKFEVTFLYSEGQKLAAILERKVVQTDSDRVILIFRMEEVPSGFDYTRNQSIKIILESKSGISFPSSALRVVDGVQGVYVVAGNVVKFKQVDIIDSSNSKFLSKIPDENTKNPNAYLSKFDRVITGGKDLYVGKILD
ncbi:MAG: hypothetical protein IKT50_02900 [Clostridia bacterium]|nr:hypothetical protein [Clostridia bacterium]